jgi:hypothetical protein
LKDALLKMIMPSFVEEFRHEIKENTLLITALL